MKKSLIILITVLVLLCAVLSACGSTNEKQDQIVGSWEMTAVSVGYTELSSEEVKSYLKETGAEATVNIVFNNDNTLKFSGLGDKVDPNGRWSVKKETYSIKDGNETLKGTINKDGNLEIVFPDEQSSNLSSDMLMTFEKKAK